MGEFDAAVVTISDTGWAGEREDVSGPLLADLLMEAGARTVVCELVPDEREQISGTLTRLCEETKVDLIITTGGTGLAPRDVTPEATLAVIDRQAPGFVELIRHRSAKITPMAALSRAVSGIRARTLIINFPGSPKACREAFAIIKPSLPHALEIIKGEARDNSH